MSHDDAPTPERCTLNGFMNNFVECLERLSVAVQCSSDADPPSPESVARIQAGEKSVAYWPSSPRMRALEQFDEQAMPALESWYAPSLTEARNKDALAAVAPVLREALASIKRMRHAAAQAKPQHDATLLAARDAAHSAFAEMEAVRSLVLEEGTQEQPVSEVFGEHRGQVTTGLAPASRAAWDSYQWALSKRPDLHDATDKEAFEYIVQHYPDRTYADAEYWNWSRYLRIARKAHGEQMNSSRAGRRGRSIMGP